LDARHDSSGDGMTDEQVLSQGMEILIAGHITTSSALCWTLYLLGKHPAYLQKARDEFDTVVGDGPLLLSHIEDLKFNVQIVDEVLRIYPSFWMTDRVALCDDLVDRVHIPKGTTIIAFIYGAHHDPLSWKDPDDFLPERFDDEAKKGHRAFSHIPFGGGPRSCIGARYALLQMLIILNIVIRKYDFELSRGRTVELNPGIVLRPRHGITMRFRRVATPS
jgi:cytochrome P450